MARPWRVRPGPVSSERVRSGRGFDSPFSHRASRCLLKDGTSALAHDLAMLLRAGRAPQRRAVLAREDDQTVGPLVIGGALGDHQIVLMLEHLLNARPVKLSAVPNALNGQAHRSGRWQRTQLQGWPRPYWVQWRPPVVAAEGFTLDFSAGSFACFETVDGGKRSWVCV